jgi:hypothetical protein
MHAWRSFYDTSYDTSPPNASMRPSSATLPAPGTTQIAALKYGAGQADAAVLAVRQLPAGFTDALLEAGGQAVEQRAQAEVAAQRIGVSLVAPACMSF